ncbi:MAG: phosphoribosylglycinamide formyltransferase [Acidimicrobiales bacterium]|jgi:phosphoribosylglycinamide formyltransferase-1|nr:phosphoribosylglycinamide formyltransferase [Acidimicrobiaceae bacterium]MDP6077859.1 phosphoribosylglycinamide formyltransferase [Acidimicrobiales bacterium]MDP7259180.1 phosphoribosylglycinamide formyltransferase [Acidimicrobiales bacterium]HJO80426.1 phosphoribosylglycinamide formyltransferase [Acidimicrobiales bacterium]|tara:strand:+ start:15776 stop:16354 length:579 start_codon:yes stop_codon:yes gene_type:complete
MRLAVLASGTGSILEAIVDAGLPVHLVVTDRPCGALDLAASLGISTRIVERDSFGDDFDRNAYTVDLVDVLVKAGTDLIAMAGFGTILAKPAYDKFADRILNTHPALLPAFPGWHSVAEAMVHGVKVTGCTVHVATLEVDSGPILAQEAVSVLPDDDEESLHERIKMVERRLYPETIRAVLENRTLLMGEYA